ncbi:MAG: prolyl oligopeptidase family serine peptidase [Verrucomicrobiae bacterium]|nr:prolyl oligopeptidase family serine peptidase [Verrucomicrobiae bacterium]
MKALVLAAALAPLLSAAPLRVAVIGDSISTGAHAEDPQHNGYPARLGHLFGEKAEVRAFARGGACLSLKAGNSLTNSPIFKRAVAWKPDVAVVMLGTNDSNTSPDNWKNHGDLESDARFVLNSLRAANPDVEIHFAGPPPMFPDRKGLKPERAANLKERVPHIHEIRRIYQRIAEAEPGVFHHSIDGALRADGTSDGVHPDTFGHQDVANQLFEQITIRFDENHDVRQLLVNAGVEPKRSLFHGCVSVDFPLPGNGAACKIVAPSQSAEGRPWIWRARFFGHEPELDLSLLDRGFHIGYCDVSNLYGGPGAMERWDAFYQFATETLGLSKKPVLEGMSRGGLPIFLWASRNPEKVAAIYGDNPVCDFRTWPGGHGGKRSEDDWKRLLAAWNLDQAAAMKHQQPRDESILGPIASAKIPVALVLGSADDVVPPKQNGEELAANLTKLGGVVKVWRKPGAGHHPHGLHPAGPLRRFLLAATGRETNPAIVPVPSSEYRAAGQGWPKGLWRNAFADVKRAAEEHPDARVVFLGDSISQALTGHKDRVSHAGGSRPIDKVFGEGEALSLGLSGDRTEHLLWRIDHGQFDGLKPEWVVLMIGVNNINTGGHTGEETAAGTAAVVKRLKAKLPETRILMLGCFPAGERPDDPRRTEIDALHKGVAPLADDERVFYQDLRPMFLEADGTLNDLMTTDAIHLNAKGQAAWLAAIMELISAP